MTLDRYEYRYEDRAMTETLQVNLHTYRYDYRWVDRRTGREIRWSGAGRPLSPAEIYRQMRGERQRAPGFRLIIRIGF